MPRCPDPSPRSIAPPGGGAALCLAAATAAGQDEVPFVTTPDAVTLAMLEIAGVAARDHVVDLGSGDGRIVITAARRFGARGLGVEIVPRARAVEPRARRRCRRRTRASSSASRTCSAPTSRRRPW
jgi:hypothetical protein